MVLSCIPRQNKPNSLPIDDKTRQSRSPIPTYQSRHFILKLTLHAIDPRLVAYWLMSQGTHRVGICPYPAMFDDLVLIVSTKLPMNLRHAIVLC